MKLEKCNYQFSKKVEVLFDIDLKIKRNQIHCLFGPNGSGKSTLINVLAGLLKMNSGQIIL